LIAAETRLTLLRRGEHEAREIVRVTTAFAETGQGSRADANRARANADLILSQTRDAEGAIAAASARLARLLNLDTATLQLRTPGGPIERLQLIAEDTDLDALLDRAIRSRPDLFARSAAVEAERIRVKQERVRPWVPTLTLGYSSGWFGGGSNLVASEFGSLSGRGDFTAMAVWTVQNLGAGNYARVGRASSVMAQAEQARALALNQVQREVAEAQAAAKTAARQIQAARQGLEAAEEGFRLENERILLGQGRPIEALDLLHLLLDARSDLVRALLAYDVAQFRLLVALGVSPAEEND
jgi:outer membrane protein TolC